MMNTTTELDTELAEDRQLSTEDKNLTGDPLPTVIQIDNMEKNIYQCAPDENNIPKYILLDNDFEILHSLTYFHMVVVHITQKRDKSSYIFGNTFNNIYWM